MPRKPADIVQYKLRIREGLRRGIEQAAKKNRRSANQEMVARLAGSFQQEPVRQLESIVDDMFRILETLTDRTREAEALVTRLTGQIEGRHDKTNSKQTQNSARTPLGVERRLIEDRRGQQFDQWGKEAKASTEPLARTFDRNSSKTGENDEGSR